MGCWDFFSLQGFFSQPLSLQDLFLGANLLHNFFFFGGGEGVGVAIGGGIFYCCNLNLDTHHNLNAWNRLQVKPNNF